MTPPSAAPEPRRPVVSSESTIGERDLTHWPTRAGRRLLAVVAAVVGRLGPWGAGGAATSPWC